MSKIPTIQKRWRKYMVLWEDEQGALSFPERVLKSLEILTSIVPIIFAIYHYSSLARPKKYMGHKKNRNI